MKIFLAIAINLLLLPVLALAQKTNWQNLDLKTDSVFGISTEKAYIELIKNKKSTPVTVAVIDAGVDTGHEDLKAILWKNPKEQQNGKDDDKNGYTDDVHGWGFLGSSKGNVHYDNLELTRQVRQGKAKFNGIDIMALKGDDLKAFNVYQKNEADLNKRILIARANIKNIEVF